MLIAHDAEVFLKKDGVPLPICGLLGEAGKHNPLPVNEGTIQEDNVMGEMTITPSSTKEEFSRRTLSVMDQLLAALPVGTELYINGSCEFTAEDLAHPAAQRFGCSPDYDAWTSRKNPPPPLVNSLVRTAGGHIHMSHPLIEEDQEDTGRNVIKWMDVMVGGWLTSIDNDTVRRQFYGKAGCYRPTDYGGVEYRVPSNIWLQSKELMEEVFERTAAAIKFGTSSECWVDKGIVMSAINLSNKESLQYLEKLTQAILGGRYG